MNPDPQAAKKATTRRRRTARPRDDANGPAALGGQRRDPERQRRRGRGRRRGVPARAARLPGRERRERRPARLLRDADRLRPRGGRARRARRTRWRGSSATRSSSAATPDAPLETLLRVIVGTTFHGTLAPAPRDTTPAHAAARGRDRRGQRARRSCARRSGRRTSRCSSRRCASRARASRRSRPVRVYSSAGHDAVRFVYNGPTELDYWGIQQTSWTDAPILEGPTLTRTIGGREYRLYFNGPKLHMVAFEENGAAYWVIEHAPRRALERDDARDRQGPEAGRLAVAPDYTQSMPAEQRRADRDPRRGLGRARHRCLLRRARPRRHRPRRRARADRRRSRPGASRSTSPASRSSSSATASG